VWVFSCLALAHPQSIVENLLDSGRAYHCFCTRERLAQVRHEQQQRGEPTMYDRCCSWLPDRVKGERLASGVPHVVRLRMDPMASTVVHDAVHGRMVFPHISMDDPVLLKSDGFPTYVEWLGSGYE
jgi:glutamyl/glutaminyl-tRNA synthetase